MYRKNDLYRIILQENCQIKVPMTRNGVSKILSRKNISLVKKINVS